MQRQKKYMKHSITTDLFIISKIKENPIIYQTNLRGNRNTTLRNNVFIKISKALNAYCHENNINKGNKYYKIFLCSSFNYNNTHR